MTHNDIRLLLAKVLNNNRPMDWPSDYRFLGDALDSLDHASFVLAVEEAAGFRVPDEDLMGLDTIENVLAYAARRTAKK